MVVAVVRAQQAYPDAKFQMKVAGYACRPPVADTRCNEELALIAVLSPLQVVFATSGIKSGKMSRQYLTMFPAPGTAQPVRPSNPPESISRQYRLSFSSHHGNM